MREHLGMRAVGTNAYVATAPVRWSSFGAVAGHPFRQSAWEAGHVGEDHA